VKTFLGKFRDITISGILAPLYVFLIIFNKAWKSLSSIGAGIAQMLGMKSVLGVGGATLSSGLLVIVILLVTGLLARYSFFGAVGRAAERQLSKYVPDYDSYKAKAEERFRHKVRVLPYVAALIRRGEYWQPGYIVEQDQDGNCVVFVPEYRIHKKAMFFSLDRTKLELWNPSQPTNSMPY
jgi:hypothetical protein